jgi:hypothetical protein
MSIPSLVRASSRPPPTKTLVLDYTTGLFQMVTHPENAPCAVLGAVYRLEGTPPEMTDKKLAELRRSLALEAFTEGKIPYEDVSWGWDRRSRSGVPMVLVEPLKGTQHPLKEGEALAALRAHAEVRVPLESHEGKKLAAQLGEDTRRRRKLILASE